MPVPQDATFCSILNDWKKSIGADALRILGRCLIFGIWTVMLVYVIWRAVHSVLEHADVRNVGLVQVDPCRIQGPPAGAAPQRRRIRD